MPIKIQDSLPAIEVLNSENIFVMTNDRAKRQDIRALQILILNLMPNKIETETQLLRLLSNSALQLEVSLLQVKSHVSKNTARSHMKTFYKTFDDVKNNKFDGLIITGAPVEKLNFEQVDYWDELCEIMQWSKTSVYSTFHICWGAQAGLYYHFGIPKHELSEKLSGVFVHKVIDEYHPLLRGFDDSFSMVHSRHTDIRPDDIKKHKELVILASSNVAGATIIANKNGRQFFITGHAEYDRNTLGEEYFRDSNRGLNPKLPQNYFPNDNPMLLPKLTWRSHANLLFTNWLNYYVYQRTPYDINNIGM